MTHSTARTGPSGLLRPRTAPDYLFRHGAAVNAAIDRRTGPVTNTLTAYITAGGTYVIASNPEWNDDDRPHDLVAVLPLPVMVGETATYVLPLRLTVSPDLVDALRTALDGADRAGTR